jgi:hypothetical protein
MDIWIKVVWRLREGVTHRREADGDEEGNIWIEEMKEWIVEEEEWVNRE